MTRADKIEIMAKELAKSEQMSLVDCRRWIERCQLAVERREMEARRAARSMDEWGGGL